MNSLGIDKAPAQTRVVAAMSGGVDSAVVAALLAGEGYDVVGVTLQLYDHGSAVGRKGACCAGQDIHDARRIADRLGIPHYVLDYEARFRAAVMDDFAATYARGETPIPCVRCNQRVKFRDLLETARELGADALATGHYARRIDGPDGPELHAAADPGRDQSYFLFATTAEQLGTLRFPLGGQAKAETRAMARRLGLTIADKADSQDICFVPNGSYARVVERLRPGAAEPGDIVHVDGRVLGRHEGIIGYTVGQRRGLGVGGSAEPLFVVGLDAAARRVVVGPKQTLARDRVILGDVNWLTPEREGGPEQGAGRRITVKLRSSQTPAPARVRRLPDGAAEVLLDTLLEGIAPGQAAVFYDGPRVLGGGWIRQTALRQEARHIPGPESEANGQTASA
jgi:tRNA-specific 2-thiouridylase